MTKQRLNPDDIASPGRIIVNMLGNLQRYCPNKTHGCEWTVRTLLSVVRRFDLLHFVLYISSHAPLLPIVDDIYEMCRACKDL